MKIEDGRPEPPGAHHDGEGVNFALFSANATAVDLCLFASDGTETRLRLPKRTEDVWHGYVRGLAPGLAYGYRVHGRYEPAVGHRFNPAKLVIDPYARALTEGVAWHDETYPYSRIDGRREIADERDSAPFVPKAIVRPPARPVDAAPPRGPIVDAVIYEAHVKGLTMRHPDVPEAIRGTYDALGHPAVIRYLTDLGVTALQLLPIHAFADEPALQARGLSNYWGYASVAYLAPEPRYFGPRREEGLRDAIRALHAAGIEVILDVVYNHTGEGDETGPQAAYRGIDNPSYYKLDPDEPGLDLNWTGCGNTFDVAHPRVLRLVMDSLRHWVEAYGVDGFRFDLATSLARAPHAYDRRAAFLQAVAQDPVLARVRLIAEAWDLGPDGYRVGEFPQGWSEWNDKVREAVRGFWRGDPGRLPKLTQALTGSKETFLVSGRGPSASINYVCSHDGFTLEDLVSYEQKHNEANGEGNRDGNPNNTSANYGVEGPSDDPAIRTLRDRQKRNMLATVLLSQGVPMLLMGDELGRSQGGNNNAYCQDNATTWLDWGTVDADLLAFARHAIALRRGAEAFRRRDFLTGAATAPDGRRDVHWLAPDGREMEGADWADEGRSAFGMQIGNDAPDGRRFLLLANSAASDAPFRLAATIGGPWHPVLDTADRQGHPRGGDVAAGGSIALEGRSLLVLEAVR